MKLYVTIPVLAAMGFLSACGSSSQAPQEFSAALVDDTFNLFRADTTRLATVDDLSGEANMTGYYTMGFAENLSEVSVSEGVWGSAQVTADFEAATVSGSVNDLGVYDFVEYDDVNGVSTMNEIAPLNGNLSIDGNIIGTDFQTAIIGNLTGTQEDLGAFSADVDTTSYGSFYVLEDSGIAMDGDSLGSIGVTSENEGTFSIDVASGRLIVIE